MVLSDAKIKDYMKRLLQSRMRILCNNGFYGHLLMHMLYTLDETTPTISTDGYRIYMNPDFLEGISDMELDYAVMHELLHTALGHYEKESNKEDDGFDETCDDQINKIMFSDKSRFISDLGEKGAKCYLGRARGTYDDHSKWGITEDTSYLRGFWMMNIASACEAVPTDNNWFGCGSIPEFAQRMMKELKNPQIDWRTILSNFIQEEITDYSFVPPDKRFSESEFFLPDYNEKDARVEDILFMIDTSGSMSDEMVNMAYSEVKGAIDQFNGKLVGWLGFFDAIVIDPIPFTNEEEFKHIKPSGWGGTCFDIIFRHVQDHMKDRLPVSIIILTDGYADFPAEEMAMGIPVLWLLNNNKVKPPWGKVARMNI